jgi:hypothetical protein
MRIYSRELTENPPADALVQTYFMMNKWWEPPSAEASGDAGAGEDEVWENPYPDETE